jgi:hypothetical protein
MPEALDVITAFEVRLAAILCISVTGYMAPAANASLRNAVSASSAVHCKQRQWSLYTLMHAAVTGGQPATARQCGVPVAAVQAVERHHLHPDHAKG